MGPQARPPRPEQLFTKPQTAPLAFSERPDYHSEHKGQSGRGYLPHKAAHRISELNLFLYLRISGVSLCGLVLVGFTLTTEPFRVGSCLMASGLIPSQENPTETQHTWNYFLYMPTLFLPPSPSPRKYAWP